MTLSDPLFRSNRFSLMECSVSLEETQVPLPHPIPSSSLVFCKELEVTERWAVTNITELQDDERQTKYLTKVSSFCCFKNKHFLLTWQQNIPEKKNYVDPQLIPCFLLLQYILLHYVFLCTGLKLSPSFIQILQSRKMVYSSQFKQLQYCILGYWIVLADLNNSQTCRANITEAKMPEFALNNGKLRSKHQHVVLNCNNDAN